MLLRTATLCAMVLLQDAGAVPEEAKGLRVLWVPVAVAGPSNTAPGFKFRHPVSQEDLNFSRAKDFAAILDQLPAQVKGNGIWVSTTNGFLYSEQEEQEIRILATLAKAKGIYVFRCELGDQPRGWKKVDG